MGQGIGQKKAKWHLTKVKCFNYDNHGHLAKDYPKPFQVCDYYQGKVIILGGFMANIGAHKIEASNLLKLKCKINNKLSFVFWI
jgi:hypothetical protein